MVLIAELGTYIGFVSSIISNDIIFQALLYNCTHIKVILTYMAK